VKDRLVLSDAAWDRMAPLIIGRPDQKGSTGRDKMLERRGRSREMASTPTSHMRGSLTIR
jgi:hypothetical protein